MTAYVEGGEKDKAGYVGLGPKNRCVVCHTVDHDRGSRMSCRITTTTASNIPIVIKGWIHFQCYSEEVTKALDEAEAIERSRGVVRITDEIPLET